ncbi:MAG: MGMT family protein [Acidimicrobiales bacterium]
MIDLVAGNRRSLDDLLVDFGDAPAFDRSAWELARTIPPGDVMTYGAMAKRLGQPGGAQAVGGAMGRNPVPLIVPCHRVIAADGKLGGFSANGGTVTKRRLLEIEGAPIDRSLF